MAGYPWFGDMIAPNQGNTSEQSEDTNLDLAENWEEDDDMREDDLMDMPPKNGYIH